MGDGLGMAASFVIEGANPVSGSPASGQAKKPGDGLGRHR